MNKKLTTRQIKTILAGILLLSLSALVVMALLKFSVSSSAPSIDSISLTKEEAQADGEDTVGATIHFSPLLTDEKLWVGLKVTPARLANSNFTHQGFYVAEQNNEPFVLINEEGLVSFQIKSLKEGVITYQPYLARLSEQGKSYFIPLAKNFSIIFR